MSEIGYWIILLGGILIVVNALTTAISRWRNLPKDPDEEHLVPCPHCGTALPKLALECLECHRPLKRRRYR